MHRLSSSVLYFILVLTVLLPLRAETASRVLILVRSRWVIARRFFPILEVLSESDVLVDIAGDLTHEHVFWEDYASGATSEPVHTLSVPLVYQSVDLAACNVMLIPGADSHHALISNDLARSILSEAATRGLVIGGIGQGVSVLLEFGLMAGHRAMFGPGEEGVPRTPKDQRIVEEAGGSFAWECVVVSHKPKRGFTRITARAQCVCSFSRAVVQAISEGKQTPDDPKVRSAG